MGTEAKREEVEAGGHGSGRSEAVLCLELGVKREKLRFPPGIAVFWSGVRAEEGRWGGTAASSLAVCSGSLVPRLVVEYRTSV